MRVKIFTIPIIGAEPFVAEMNAFLGSRKILELEKQLILEGQHAFWSFCITYLETGVASAPKEKTDYKKVLDEKSFARFSRMREIRKRLSSEEGVPAYAVFTDEELVAMAKLEDLTLANIKNIKGVGEKKVEKYGQFFIAPEEYEKSE